jgi:hypothetical protein
MPLAALLTPIVKTERMRYGMQWLLPQGAMHWSRVAAARDRVLPALR